MKTFLAFLGEILRHWRAHEPGRMSAALSYYTLFSLAPLLVIVIAFASIFLGQSLVEGTLFAHLQVVFGNEVADFIKNLVTQSQTSGKGVTAAVLGIITFLIGAIGTLGALSSSLNELWEAPPEIKQKEPLSQKLVRAFEKRAPLLLVIFIVGLLFFVSIFSSILLDTIGQRIALYLPSFINLASLFFPVISFILLTVFIVVLYRFLPRIQIPLRVLTLGAMVTSALFLLGEFLIKFYLAHSAQSSVFGAAGAVILILLWMFYSAQIFLIGASFTYIYAKEKKLIS